MILYPQPDGRGILPRKWSVDKLNGPLIYLAEIVLKRLIQHGFPAEYSILPFNSLHPNRVEFRNGLGETEEFLTCLVRCVGFVFGASRVKWTLVGSVLSLDGHYVLRLRHALGRVVGASVHRCDPTDAPF